MHRLTCGEKKICWNIKKSQNIMKMVVGSLWLVILNHYGHLLPHPLKWLNRLLLLIPYHMRKTNFITQLILKIKQTHCSSSLWTCLSMLNYTHLKQPTNVCCFHGPLITSKTSSSHLKLFVRYSSLLKNPAFWLALRFFDHNWRTRFLPNMLFL